MSGKQAKRYARLVRKNQKKIIREFMKVLKGLPLKDRLQVAWAIIRGK